MRSSSGDAQATARTLLEASMIATLASSARPTARAISGSPAPDWTAAETSASPASGAAAAAFVLLCATKRL